MVCVVCRAPAVEGHPTHAAGCSVVERTRMREERDHYREEALRLRAEMAALLPAIRAWREVPERARAWLFAAAADRLDEQADDDEGAAARAALALLRAAESSGNRE